MRSTRFYLMRYSELPRGTSREHPSLGRHPSPNPIASTGRATDLALCTPRDSLTLYSPPARVAEENWPPV